MPHIEKTAQELRHELDTCQRTASQQNDSLNETIMALRADLHMQQRSSSAFVDPMRRASLICFLSFTSFERTKIANLEKTVQELRNQFATANQSLSETINSLRADLDAERQKQQSSSALIATLTCISLTSSPLDSKITHPEHTVQELNVQLDESHHKADSLIRIIRAHEQIHQCESLYVQGCIHDAAESLLAIANATNEDPSANKTIINWLAGKFQHRTLKESI